MLLELKVNTQRFAAKERQERGSQRLVLGTVRECDVVVPEDALPRRVKHHHEPFGTVVVKHLSDGVRILREGADESEERVKRVGGQ